MRLRDRLQRLEAAAGPRLSRHEETHLDWAITENLLTMVPAGQLEEARRKVEAAPNARTAQDVVMSYVPTETLHQLQREIEADLRGQGIEVPE